MAKIANVFSLAATLALSSAAALAEGVDGKKIYEMRCAFCHGPEGRGDGPAGAALKPPATSFTTPGYAQTPIDRVKQAIVQGKQGTAMMAFGATLKPEEVEAVARYVLRLAQ